ncbi:MAG: type IX secretion system protein PorQ [Flavitalea sp.]
MKYCNLIIVFLLKVVVTFSQTTGGNSAFSFSNLSNTPQLTALGGINISNRTGDIGLAFNNPALLTEAMHTQGNLVFTTMYGGIRNYHLQFAYRAEKIKTNFAAGVNYFNYGSTDATDASGNILGAISPVDYVAQLSASRIYLSKWSYGATLKFIRSNYGAWRAAAIAMDIGVTWYDSSVGVQSSLVIKNMGAQVQHYTGSENEDLPFDIQLGISKRLKNAPLQFSFTANRLHRFDITYDDTAFNSENGFNSTSGKAFSFDNIFRHIILAAQIYVGDKVELSAGYSYLRRKELNIGSSGNGLNGFSAGVGVLFPKLQIRYGRTYYQSNRSYHQFGLNLKLRDYIKAGKVKSSIGY